MKCPYCNAPLQEGVVFCQSCGSQINPNPKSDETTVLSAHQQMAASDVYNNSFSGNIPIQNSVYRTNNVDFQNDSVSAGQAVVKKKRHTGLIIAVVVIFVAVVAAAGFFILPKIHLKSEAEDAYLKPLDNYREALNSNTVSYDEYSYFGTASSFFDELYVEIFGELTGQQLSENSYYPTWPDLSEKYGDDFEMDYKITAKEKLSKTRLTYMQNEWKIYILNSKNEIEVLRDYGKVDEKDLKHLSKITSEMESKKVTDGYYVTCKFYNKKDGISDSDIELEGFLLKIGDEWVFATITNPFTYINDYINDMNEIIGE